jgi:hypothetical protein
MLIRPANTEVVDGIQTERVQPGRNVALGNHDERSKQSKGTALKQ